MSMPPTIPETICVSLVGIAGAGKSTLAPLLARALGWPHLDTDQLLEAYMGGPLQDIYDAVGREAFLDLEERTVASLAASRLVVSTGGSVAYSPKALARLRLLGPVVWLRVSLPTFLARVGPADGRGFVRRPGAGLEDIYAERQPLYAKASDFTVDTDQSGPEECARAILDWLTCRYVQTGRA